MLGKAKNTNQATLFIPGNIRDYIPDDHILVRVDKVLDLSWVADAVRDTYNESTGRPSIPPEQALRLMLAGFFLGIVHDRHLMREGNLHLAVRWFAGYSLTQKLPNHSSLTRIRSRWGAELFKSLFARIVAQCQDAGLVSGDTVHVDATLIRADVSWESLSRQHAENVIKENTEDDDAPPPAKKRGRPTTVKKRRKRKSKTDPDASLSTNCQTKAMIPCFKQHTAVDDQAGIIVDIDVQTGEDNEGKRMREVIERVEDRTGKKVENVTGDAGYGKGENYQYCEDRNINAVIPPQKVSRRKKDEKMPMRRFKYDERNGTVTCPAGKKLKRGKTGEHGTVYRARTCDCKNCQLRQRCFGQTASARIIIIRHEHSALHRARRKHERGWDDESKNLYQRHRSQVEGVHGESKSCHGLARAVRRGVTQVLIQSLMAACTINLKRLAKAADVNTYEPVADKTKNILVIELRYHSNKRKTANQQKKAATRNYFRAAA